MGNLGAEADYHIHFANLGCIKISIFLIQCTANCKLTDIVVLKIIDGI